MSAQARKKRDFYYLHVVIVLILMFGFRFLPEFGQMTQQGMEVFGVFLGGLYGWITIGLLWPSIIGMIALGTTSAISLNQLFINGFGSQFVIMTAVLLLIAAFIAQVDLSGVIANWLLSRRIVQGKPWGIILFFLLAVYFISLVTTSLVAIVLCMPLYQAVVDKAHIPPYHKLNSVFLCGMALAVSMADVALPFKAQILVLIGTATSMGLNLNLAQFVAAALPATIFIVVLYVIICKFVMRVDAAFLKNIDLAGIGKKATKKQVVSLICILCLLIALLLPNLLPKTFFLTVLLNGWGYGGIAFLILAIMMVIRIDGEPLVRINKLSKDFSWDVYILCAYFIPTASLLVSDITGVKPTITALFQPLLQALSSPYIFLAVIVILTVLLTNFFNNLVTCTLSISLMSILAESLPGLNIYSALVLVTIASSFSMATPAASPVNAYVFSKSEYLKFKTHLLHSSLCCIVLTIVSVIIFPFVFGLIF